MLKRHPHRSPDPSSDYLTPADCAVALHVTARTIRQWIACGRLRAVRTDPGRGGRLLVRRSDLDGVLLPVVAGGVP